MFQEANGINTGLVDAFWDPGLNSFCRDVAIIDNMAVLCGAFTTVNGGAVTRNRAAAFNLADGASAAVADAWDPNMDNVVYDIEPSGTDGALVTGVFSTVGGNSKNRIAGFNSGPKQSGLPIVCWPIAGALVAAGIAALSVPKRKARR